MANLSLSYQHYDGTVIPSDRAIQSFLKTKLWYYGIHFSPARFRNTDPEDLLTIFQWSAIETVFQCLIQPMGPN